MGLSMHRLHDRMRTPLLRRMAVVYIFVIVTILTAGSPLAHEGHDHGAETRPAPAARTSPRVVATSETYQFVGIVEGEVLVIYLDYAADNTPVTTGKIELTLDGEQTKVEPNQRDSTYEATSQLLRKPGSHEVLVKLSDGSTNDLLVGALVIPAQEKSAEGPASRIWRMLPDTLVTSPTVYLVGFMVIITVLAAAVRRVRRKGFFFLTTAVGLTVASAFVLAHEGHDHGPDLSASAGNSPARRPDGSIFLPKTTPRLLASRTRAPGDETRTRNCP